MSAWRWRAATSTSHTPGMQVNGRPVTKLQEVYVQQDRTKAGSVNLCCIGRGDGDCLETLLLRLCLSRTSVMQDHAALHGSA